MKNKKQNMFYYFRKFDYCRSDYYLTNRGERPLLIEIERFTKPLSVRFLFLVLVIALLLSLVAYLRPVDGTLFILKPNPSQIAILSVTRGQEKEVIKPYASSTAEIIEYYAKINGADPNLAYWVAYCESRLNNVPNTAGARYGMGIYQFVRSTWDSRCEGDVWNVEDNINCGTKLLGLGELHHWQKYSGSCWLPHINN